MPKRIWVNFRELRAKLRFEDVLRHYGVEIRKRGDQHQGFCPLPNHQGSRHSPSFSANLERGIFHCFGCGAKGNQLEFACLMSGHSPEDGDALRAVAVELQQKLAPRVTASRRKTDTEPVTAQTIITPVVVNAPLDFELKNLDAGHAYLAGRGFTRETMRFFGVGFCGRGMLQGRIAIPLHDNEGRLLGFAGRVIDDHAISDENPKYRLPSRREHNGTIHEFRKSLFLYNGFRITAPCDDLAVVEGFPSVWWLNQHGIPWSVALMGSECSDEQAERIVQLVKPDGRIWFIPDGDKAGRRLADSFFDLVATRRFTRWIKLGEGRQPTDLPASTLKENFAL